MLYSFDDNCTRMHETDDALKEIDLVYKEVERISDKYSQTLNVIVARLYQVYGGYYPMSKEDLDKLDTVT